MSEKKDLINVTSKFMSTEEGVKEIPKVLRVFERELNEIKNTELNAFFSNSLLLAPKEFKDDDELHLHIKRAFIFVHDETVRTSVQGEAKDALLGMVLIAKILKHEIKGKYANIYPFLLDEYLKEVGVNKEGTIPYGLYKNIMKEIQVHLGHEAITEAGQANPGTLGYELYRAFSSANVTGLAIDIDAYYASL